MPLILRGIRKNRWIKKSFPGGIALPADAFDDVKTLNNGLSVWIIEDNRSNLTQVITALASTKPSLSNIDYVLVDARHIVPIFPLDPAPGETADASANPMHRNISNLSAPKLYELVSLIDTHGNPDSMREKEVCEHLVRGIMVGRLEEAKVQVKTDKFISALRIAKGLPP